MKTKHSSRILALALVLVMLVPMISIPALAEDETAATETLATLVTQDFASVNTETLDSAVNAGVYNEADSIAYIDGEHGNAYYFDMSNGPDTQWAEDGTDAVYLAYGNDWFVTVTVTETTADGKVTGYATAKADGSTEQTVYIKEAVVNTNNFATVATIYSDAEYTNKLTTDAGYKTFYLTNGQVRNSLQGDTGNSVAGKATLQHEALTGKTLVTYSADYYFEDGWNSGFENSLLGGTFRLLGISKNENNLVIGTHENTTMINGSTIKVATNTWFNISIVVDFTAAKYTVYVNGKYAYTAVDSVNLVSIKNKTADAIPANSWALGQVQRGSAVSTHAGYYMVDNCTIYDGAMYAVTNSATATNSGDIVYADFNDQSLSQIVSTTFANNQGTYFDFINAPGVVEDNDYAAFFKADSSTTNTNPLNDIQFRLKHDKLAYGSYTDKEIVLEADYYFAKGAVIKTESQIYQYTTNGGSNAWWLNLFQLLSYNSKITLTNNGSSATASGNSITIEQGKWFTVSVKINLVSGAMELYVNGVLHSTSELKENLELNENSWIAIKMMKVANSSETGKVYSGYYGIDNARIYTMDADSEGVDYAADNPTASYSNTGDDDAYIPSYILSKNFNNGSLNTTANGASASNKYAAYGDKAFVTNAENSDMVNNSVYLSQSNGDTLSYTTHPVVILEADYYFPSTTYAKVQSQITNVTNGASNGWNAIYTIMAMGGKVYLNAPNGETEYSDANVYYPAADRKTALPVDRWFTLSTVINMTTGAVAQFVDGAQVNAWTFQGGATNLSFTAGNYIYSKLNNLDSSAFPDGYSGDFAVDNVEIFTDTAMIQNYTPYDETYFCHDYEYATEGAHASSACSTTDPVSATYTKLNGNMAVKFDLFWKDAPTSNVKGDFFGTGTRLYWLTNGETVLVPDQAGTFDAAPATATVEETSGLTLIQSSYNNNQDMRFVLRIGNTAYIYGGSYHNQYTSGGKTYESNIPEAGTVLSLNSTSYTIVSASDDTAAGLYDAMIGGGNADARFTVVHGAYTYDETEGANNTYVFSADYYVASGAKGTSESQFLSGSFYNLYQINFATAKLTVTGKTLSATGKIDAWNNVTMIVTLTSTGTGVDIYYNGVYVGSQSFSGLTTIKANSFIAAKVMKNSNITNHNEGSFYLDNVSCSAYDETKAYKYDENADYAYYLNGKGYTKDLYTDGTVIRVPKATHAIVSALALKTENKSSIRCGTSSGLRFRTIVNTEAINSLINSAGDSNEVVSVTYGTLIAPTDLLGGAELSFDIGEAGKDYLDVVTNTGKFYTEAKNDETTNSFTGSIVNIYESNMTREFTGRGYCKITLQDGTVLVIYSDYSHSISVAAQAQATLDSGVNLGDAKSTVEYFASFLKPAE